LQAGAEESRPWAESFIEALPQKQLEPRSRDVALVVSAVVHEPDDLVHKAGGERCVGEFVGAEKNIRRIGGDLLPAARLCSWRARFHLLPREPHHPTLQKQARLARVGNDVEPKLRQT
jgi:hypothetical protein